MFAHERTPGDLAAALSADLLILQTLPELVSAVWWLTSIPAFARCVFTRVLDVVQVSR